MLEWLLHNNLLCSPMALDGRRHGTPRKHCYALIQGCTAGMRDYSRVRASRLSSCIDSVSEVAVENEVKVVENRMSWSG